LNPRRVILLGFLCVLIFVLAITVINPTHTSANSTRAAALLPQGNNPPPNLKTRAVVLIVLDGFRWQEAFDGPQHDLLDEKHGGAQDAPQLRKDFWRATPDEGRETPLPFLWTVIAKLGQI
jgi:hypothetical protein